MGTQVAQYAKYAPCESSFTCVVFMFLHIVSTSEIFVELFRLLKCYWHDIVKDDILCKHFIYLCNCTLKKETLYFTFRLYLFSLLLVRIAAIIRHKKVLKYNNSVGDTPRYKASPRTPIGVTGAISPDLDRTSGADPGMIPPRNASRRPLVTSAKHPPIFFKHTYTRHAYSEHAARDGAEHGSLPCRRDITPTPPLTTSKAYTDRDLRSPFPEIGRTFGSYRPELRAGLV